MELAYTPSKHTTCDKPYLPRSSVKLLPISYILLQSKRAYAPFMHKPFMIYHPETLFQLRKHVISLEKPKVRGQSLWEYAVDNELFKEALLDEHFMQAPREWPEELESELAPYAVAYTSLLEVGDKDFYLPPLQTLKGYASGLSIGWMQRALDATREEIIDLMDTALEILENHIPFLVWYYGMNAQELGVRSGTTSNFIRGQRIKALLREDPLLVSAEDARKYLGEAIVNRPQLIKEIHQAMVRPMPCSIYLRVQYAS